MKSTYIIYFEGKDAEGVSLCDGNEEVTATNSGEGFLKEWHDQSLRNFRERYPTLERMLIKHICKL